jgi:hypothetical protein
MEGKGNGMESKRTRYRVVEPTEAMGEGGVMKKSWKKIGRAFENEGRSGRPPFITVKLDDEPAGSDFLLFVEDGKKPESSPSVKGLG